jgi:hypothetical protein
MTDETTTTVGTREVMVVEASVTKDSTKEVELKVCVVVVTVGRSEVELVIGDDELV